jgi:hypothetical protein
MTLEHIEKLVREAWPVTFNREPMVSWGSCAASEDEGLTQALIIDGIFVYRTMTEYHTVAEVKQVDAWGLGQTKIIPLPPGDDFEYDDEFEEITAIRRGAAFPGAAEQLVRELAAQVARNAC